MADATYQPKVYKKDGGDTLVIAAGGSMENQDYGTVTQATNITTAVTLNKLAGTITTQAASAAAAAEHAFTVNDSKVAATDVVLAVIKAYGGAGTPLVAVTAVAAGSFVITITNLHASAALDAAMTINFYVLKANA